MEIAHDSVLVTEVIELLAIQELHGTVVDATLGEGGHSARFLEANTHLRLIGVDADEGIIERARERLAAYEHRVVLYSQWFDEFFASYPEAEDPEAVLFDFGISSYHFDTSQRGFTFVGAEPLDMRLRASEGPTAAELVNTKSREELADIIFHYGEERYARRIAERITRERSEGAIGNTDRLAEIVRRAVPAKYRHGRIHPATRTFQALRIAVNDELGRIERGLEDAFSKLAVGGRIGCISFHSLEDRIVKRFFQRKRQHCTCPPEEPMCKCGGGPLCRLLTKKPVYPQEAEVRANPRSRSAKLRVAEKIAEKGDVA